MVILYGGYGLVQNGKVCQQQIEPLGGWQPSFQKDTRSLGETDVIITLLFETVRRISEGKTKLFEWIFRGTEMMNKFIILIN